MHDEHARSSRRPESIRAALPTIAAQEVLNGCQAAPPAPALVFLQPPAVISTAAAGAAVAAVRRVRCRVGATGGWSWLTSGQKLVGGVAPLQVPHCSPRRLQRRLADRQRSLRATLCATYTQCTIALKFLHSQGGRPASHFPSSLAASACVRISTSTSSRL